MASRIFWVMIAGLALVTGMVLQDGVSIFGWNDRVSERVDRAVDRSVDRSIDRTVDRSVDRTVNRLDPGLDRTMDHVQVVGAGGHEMQVSSQTKRQMAEAVGRLVKAEADLAVLKVRDGSDEEVQAASLRRDQARTEVETLKAQIEQQDSLSQGDRDAVRDTIREDIRDTVRDAVQN